MIKVNFFKTSNTCVSIKEMVCNFCRDTFYELEDRELDSCPLCDGDLSEIEPSENGCDDNTYTLIVDHKTGRPSILKLGEYETVMQEKVGS